MSIGKLGQLETELDALTEDEQWFIFNRLSRRLRNRTAIDRDSFDADLAAMANDPDIQRELRSIEVEFAPALLDGLKEPE